MDPLKRFGFRKLLHLDQKIIYCQDMVYLYFDSGHKQWRFANDLGGKKKLFFATEEKSVAKCPADLAAQGHWQAATGTFGRFKKNAAVKVICDRM